MDSDLKPFISIIMPAYNAESYIAESIKSVQNQSFSNWELIIINDGSSDNTSQVAQRYTHNDSRIILINQINKQQGGARNAGLKVAKGQWIAFLDADDLWDKEKLKKQLDAAESRPDADVIYTEGYIFYDNDLNNVAQYPTKCGFFPGEEMYRMEYETNYIPILSVLAKFSIVSKIGLQEEHLYYQGCEDWDYWLRMAHAGAGFLGIPDKLFYYRRHSNNMSSNSLKMRRALAATFIKNYDEKYFDISQAKKIFRPLITSLIFDLLRAKLINEATFILKGINNILPSQKYAVLKVIIDCFGARSYELITLVHRFKKLLIQK
jgi:glycosyltransferase involved in cell wall biosynthesis